MFLSTWSVCMSPSFHPLRTVGMNALLAASALVGGVLAASTALAAQAAAKPAVTPAAAPTSQAAATQAAPVAKPVSDLRSAHYRLRDACVKQANAQGLQGDAHKVFVYQCLTR
jgi:hypothetical protein